MAGGASGYEEVASDEWRVTRILWRHSRMRVMDLESFLGEANDAFGNNAA